MIGRAMAALIISGTFVLGACQSEEPATGELSTSCMYWLSAYQTAMQYEPYADNTAYLQRRTEKECRKWKK